MKPCPQHRESIALFAAGSLSAREGVRVQEHLDRCVGCNHYHRQILIVCQGQRKAAASIDSATLPAQVYDRVAREIGNPRPLASPAFADPLRIWLPRTAAAALVLMLVLGAWKLDRSRNRGLPAQVSSSISALSAPISVTTENDSSLGFYRKTVLRSLDDLDRLVTQQADRVEGFAASFRLNQGLVD